MCPDFEPLKPKNSIFVGFWSFTSVEGQICAYFKCLRHILKLKCYCYVVFGFFFEGEGGYTNSDEFLTHILK